MENTKTIYLFIMGLASMALSGIITLLGGWDSSLETLCVFMVVDYFTGIACALIWHKSSKSENGNFESHASFKGLLKKGGIFLIVLIAAKLDLISDGVNYARGAVILFFIANEGLSIIENLGTMGLPLPQWIKNAFSALKENSDKKDK